ncbi:MAG: FKBP-type peptidyl-prolyl cis-trans isomerase [Verrucomicrobiales bacterium]
MKFRPFSLLALFATASLHAGDPSTAAAAPAGAEAPAPAEPEYPVPTDPVVIKTDSSYAFGFQFGQYFLQQLGSRGVLAADVDLNAFMKGFEKSIGGAQITPQEQQKLGAALQAFDKQLQERRAKAAAGNSEDGKKFLAEIKAKPGVTATASGLLYEVLKAGEGKKYEGDGSDQPQFKVRYEGRLIDGKKFDGDLKGEPVSFGLGVIPGFREALKLMPVGSLWRLYIPAELGYGDKGLAAIPPGSTLIFDLEMVDFSVPTTSTTPPISIPAQP